MYATFPTPPTNRFFEDYKLGSTYLCGSFSITQDEIIEFAQEFDPQIMHIDPDLAAASPLGGIIASGWHTVAKSMRLMVDNFLPYNGLPGPGMEELRWPTPVRPGDTITVTITITDARPSRSKPDRGIIHMLMQATNQNDETVLSLKPVNLIRVRPR